MKKIIRLTFFLSLTTISLQAQSVYELSFAFPNTNPVLYKALLLDYNDGKGKLRLRFTSPAGQDSILADIDIAEENPANNSTCVNSDRIYYKLKTAKYIESTDPGVALPRYLCFKMDPVSMLFEPFGVTNSSEDCRADVVKFNTMAFIDQKKLTKEYVGSYFKSYDFFYRNLFVINNSKALTVNERNAKLFLLIVANVTDPKIGIADRKNMNETIAFFRSIQESLGISQFIYDTLTGVNFNKKTVEAKIKTFLIPGPYDIVVFYYTGHGFRKAKDGRPGPYIDLTVDYKRENFLDNALSTEEILVWIKNKGARLNLVLSESCNSLVKDSTAVVDAAALLKKKGIFGNNWNPRHTRELFLNPKQTTILAAAASPYQIALSNPVFGSFFSTLFRDALETQLGFSNPTVSWDNVFKQTVDQTELKASRTWCNPAKTVKCNRQRPYFKIM